MSGHLSYLSPEDDSFAPNSSVDLAVLKRNLLEDFDDREVTILSKDEQMPVYLRIRPLNVGEPPNKVLLAKNATTAVLKPLTENKGVRGRMYTFGQSSHEFTFSRVFDETTSQADIFRVMVADRVSEFLEGTNGLIFAYGTTSSGKTYSLQGTAGNGGMIPRALECVFRSAALEPLSIEAENICPQGFDEVVEVSSEEAGNRRRERALLLRLARSGSNENSSRSCGASWEAICPSSLTTAGSSLEVPFAYKHSARFVFWVSFVEIYNEVVYDLLDPSFVTASLKSTSSHGIMEPVVTFAGFRRTPLDLRTDKRGNVFVKGVRWHAVSTAEEAYALLSVGRRCQCVSATRLNQASSRSHAIFSLRALRRSSSSVGGGWSSVLSFCDLAGSERCVKAATAGQVARMREANCINTSLLTLGKCIEALRHNQQQQVPAIVVPYRESRLTRLFSNFFAPSTPGGSGGGRGRACLLVNAAPCAPLVDETLHALRFSALAAQVILPQPAPPPPPPSPPCAAATVELSQPSGDPEALAAGAVAVIQQQMRTKLMRQGFHWRCSGTKKASRPTAAAGSVVAEGEMTPINRRKTATSLTQGWTPTPVVTLVPGAMDEEGVLAELAAEVEAEVTGLSCEALVTVVRELTAALAVMLPAEVEAARAETRARLTSTIGEELLRMEEQYESLLQKQEREFKERLAKQKRRLQRLQAIQRGGTAEKEPLMKARRLTTQTEDGDVSEAETEADDDSEFSDEELEDSEDERTTKCSSCARLVKELDETREKLDEANADVANQGETIASLKEQCDVLQVEVRRLQFQMQLTTPLDRPSGASVFPGLVLPPITPQQRERPFASFFPPLPLEATSPHRETGEGPATQTPATVVAVAQNKPKAESGIGAEAMRLREENQQLLAELARLRLDMEGGGTGSGGCRRSTEAHMDSFLAHEAEADAAEQNAAKLVDVGVQTEANETAELEGVAGEVPQRRRRRQKQDHPEGAQQRRQRAGRKAKAESLEASAALVVVECSGSDAENALCEKMAQRLTAVQRASANPEDDAAETATETEQEGESEATAVAGTKAVRTKRRGGRRRRGSNHGNTGSAAKEGTGTETDTGVRRLAPLSETSQFLPMGTQETPRPPRRVLRSRRMI